MRTIIVKLLLCRAGGTPLEYGLLGALGMVATLCCVVLRVAG
jgi:hypothetical protein